MPAQTPMRVVRDAFVVLDYALHDEDGDILEATDEEGGRPIGFVFGYGTLVPGLEAKLVGMAAGETREVVVPPEEGYGAWDEEKEVWIAREDLPDELEIDDELGATDEEGEEVTMRVVEIADEAVLVDMNHPLAGETLYFDVIVRDVRPASPDEIAKTRAAAPRPSLRVVGDAPEAQPGPSGDERAGGAAEGESAENSAEREDPSAQARSPRRRAGRLTDDEQ